MEKIKTLSFIGAGNVATHLAHTFFSKGFIIQQVWSSHQENAVALAAKVNATPSDSIQDISTETDLMIISVKDDALASVIENLPKGIRAVVHTSGSMEMKLLKEAAHHIGVFYPLQSFNRNEPVDMSTVPVCIEGSSDEFTKELFELAQTFTQQIEYINSTQRAYLHVAAVFANNFTNYMYSVAYELATEKKLPFHVLLPLIKNTANRLDGTNPFKKQTGPAKRHDSEVIKKHLAMLEFNTEAKELYQFISEQIIKKTDH